MDDRDFMREAIRLARANVAEGGGPFGAVVVKDGAIVGRGVNRVTTSCDPTAHAEVCALRDAAKTLGDFNLGGAVVYTTCEPCPMCLGAIYWARVAKIFYGNTQADAAKAGFDDSFIYEQFALPASRRSIPQEALLRGETLQTFADWEQKADKTPY